MYIYYLRTLGWCAAVAVIAILIFGIGLEIGSRAWLAEWTTAKPNPDGSQDIGKRNLFLSVYTVSGFAYGKRKADKFISELW